MAKLSRWEQNKNQTEGAATVAWAGCTFDLAAAKVLPLAHVLQELLRGAADVDAHRKPVRLHPAGCGLGKNRRHLFISKFEVSNISGATALDYGLLVPPNPYNQMAHPDGSI